VIFDSIRGLQVKATPEEIVRQKWLSAMMGPLGYPKGLISVEKGIPHSSRRADILCYTPGKEGLIPLLLIECKAEDEGEVPEKQVLGYNFSIHAPFLCVIQGDRAKTFWLEGKKIAFIPFLPTYKQLISKL
jgi:hypothetical protein